MVGITTSFAFACILTRSSAAEAGTVVAAINRLDDMRVVAVSRSLAETRRMVSSRFVRARGGRPGDQSTSHIQFGWEAGLSDSVPGRAGPCWLFCDRRWQNRS